MTICTHADYCNLAAKWLLRPSGRQEPGCQSAFTEVKCSFDGEIADAFGTRTANEDNDSVLVEVKVTWADFVADRYKPHRACPETGMGVYRYYLAPEGLIKLTDLPERWGLIEVSPKGTLTVRSGHVLVRRTDQAAWRHDRSIEREWRLLATLLARVGDAERLHSELKKIKNDRDRLAKQCDRHAEQERRRNLQFAESLVNGAGSSPVARRRAAPVES